MQVNVKVVQSRELYDAMAATFGLRDGWAMRFLAAHGLSCQLTFSPAELRPDDLLCFADYPTLILAELRELAAVNRLGAMTHRLQGLLKENETIPLTVAPLIAIVNPRALSSPGAELPDFVSDWLFGHADHVELTHRIVHTLKAGKRRLRKVVLQCGELTILPDTRSISCGNELMRFSPSEFALAELFFARIGSVISLPELTAFFDAAGKSTEPNNIRVTIHQLRLKLEELTRSQLKLSTIYRRGYCLRQSGRPAAGREAGAAAMPDGGD